ncbi:MAG: septum formation initiator family protein [Deltaproteobacteria bacterium]|nr:septum formation initiator family protein [Deltaproteobacteria bacterium]
MQRVTSVLAWLLPFGLLVLAIVAVPLHLLDDHGLPRYRVLASELRQVESENERVQREVVDLSRQVEALRHDPLAIERIARDDFGMVREGELVFQFAE